MTSPIHPFRPLGRRLSPAVVAVLALLTLLPVIPTADAVEIPTPSSTAFLQTTAANANFGIGDWYTNVAGGNTNHELTIEVPCSWQAGLPLTISLFDPEINDGYTASTPYATDEVRDLSNNATPDETFAENTRFRLTDPASGVLVPWRTFTPTGGSDGLWVELLTFVPSAQPAGYGILGDTVWADLNGTGTQDFAAGTLEPGIGGVTIDVTWSGPDGVVSTVDDVRLPGAVTDAEGHYLVTNLPGGDFVVEIGDVPGYELDSPDRQVVTLQPTADVGVADSVLYADFAVRPVDGPTASATTPETLPRTGASAVETARAALVMLLVGGLLVLLARRRRVSSTDLGA